MSGILYEDIPSLDLADFVSGDDDLRARFVQNLGEDYNDIGFVAIKNHGLSQELQDRLYAVIQKFFALPEEVKITYEHPEIGFQRGYTGKEKEHAKGRNTGDLKEFFHVGQELEDIPDTDPFKTAYPPNIWPAEVEGFKEISTEVFKTIEKAGKTML